MGHILHFQGLGRFFAGQGRHKRQEPDKESALEQRVRQLEEQLAGLQQQAVLSQGKVASLEQQLSLTQGRAGQVHEQLQELGLWTQQQFNALQPRAAERYEPQKRKVPFGFQPNGRRHEPDIAETPTRPLPGNDLSH